MALQAQRTSGNQFEFCPYLFVVGNANRVDTFDNAFYFFRYFHHSFFYDLIITDDVYLDIRSNEGNPVQIIAERGSLGLAAYLAILAVFAVGTWRALGWPAGPAR